MTTTLGYTCNIKILVTEKNYRETSSALVSADLKRSPRQLNQNFNSFFLHFSKSALDIIEPGISSHESWNKLRIRHHIIRSDYKYGL